MSHRIRSSSFKLSPSIYKYFVNIKVRLWKVAITFGLNRIIHRKVKMARVGGFEPLQSGCFPLDQNCDRKPVPYPGCPEGLFFLAFSSRRYPRKCLYGGEEGFSKKYYCFFSWTSNLIFFKYFSGHQTVIEFILLGFSHGMPKIAKEKGIVVTLQTFLLT